MWGSTVSNALSEPLAASLRRVSPQWRPLIDRWQKTPAGQALISHVDGRVAQGVVVYPAQVFRALELTPLSQVKVVIVGQDPYHGPGQAHGLAFSVPSSQKPPPSLRNILAELRRNTCIDRAQPDLSSWATQGVLLLNTALTVEQAQPASHAQLGWQNLTQSLLQAVAARGLPCVYLLWGAHAQKFVPLINASMQLHSAPLILQANHPSPLSARRPPVPFIGCGHFGQTSRYLLSHGLTDIDWVA